MSHFRLHPLGQQSRVEIVERPRGTGGPGGRTLEDLFHLVIVISIQTAELLGFLERCNCPPTKRNAANLGSVSQPMLNTRVPGNSKPYPQTLR